MEQASKAPRMNCQPGVLADVLQSSLYSASGTANQHGKIAVNGATERWAFLHSAPFMSGISAGWTRICCWSAANAGVPLVWWGNVEGELQVAC
jgi:hypothetical protein